MTITVVDICRYPVKGLNAESLARVSLAPGQGLPHDRRFAIAQGSAQFDREAPQWLPKTNFFMLMRDEKLALLRASFDTETGKLSIERAGKQVVAADPTDMVGRTLIAGFFSGYLSGSARGAPKLLEAEGHMFSNVPEKFVSIVNLASVRDLERVVRQPVHPLRFRANLYIDGAPPWGESGWIGSTVRIGGASLEIATPIERCAATNVDPESGERDLNIPRSLQAGFGHNHMGVYATVTGAGDIVKGDSVTLTD
jgi:MOSC domain-containing protein